MEFHTYLPFVEWRPMLPNFILNFKNKRYDNIFWVSVIPNSAQRSTETTLGSLLAANQNHWQFQVVSANLRVSTCTCIIKCDTNLYIRICMNCLFLFLSFSTFSSVFFLPHGLILLTTSYSEFFFTSGKLHSWIAFLIALMVLLRRRNHLTVTTQYLNYKTSGDCSNTNESFNDTAHRSRLISRIISYWEKWHR